MPVRIAEAAAKIGIPAHRLRHYEEVGLLVPARTDSGYRDYEVADVDRGRQIAALIDSGFTSRDVALMLPCMNPDGDDRHGCSVTTQRLRDRLAELAQKRAQLQATERALEAWLAHGGLETSA